MLRPSTSDVYVPHRHGRGYGIGAGDDAVGHDAVLHRSQTVHTLYFDRRRTNAIDLRAHRCQHGGEIHDLRLAGRVVDHGCALREDRGHQQVLGRANAGKVEPDHRTGQPLRHTRVQETVLPLDDCTESLEAGDMHVEAAMTDVVATRHGNPDLSAPRKERTEHADRGTHPAYQVVVSLVTRTRWPPDLHGAPRDVHAAAEPP